MGEAKIRQRARLLTATKPRPFILDGGMATLALELHGRLTEWDRLLEAAEAAGRGEQFTRLREWSERGWQVLGQQLEAFGWKPPAPVLLRLRDGRTIELGADDGAGPRSWDEDGRPI